MLRAGCIATAFALCATGAVAQPYVVTDDLGGLVGVRMIVIDAFRENETLVEIRGTCASACTLFLGLDTTCVAPAAMLGFHGPSETNPEVPVTKAAWDATTRAMASYYPPALRGPFLNRWRYLGDAQLAWVSGARLIEAGVRPCKT